MPSRPTRRTGRYGCRRPRDHPPHHHQRPRRRRRPIRGAGRGVAGAPTVSSTAAPTSSSGAFSNASIATATTSSWWRSTPSGCVPNSGGNRPRTPTGLPPPRTRTPNSSPTSTVRSTSTRSASEPPVRDGAQGSWSRRHPVRRHRPTPRRWRRGRRETGSCRRRRRSPPPARAVMHRRSPRRRCRW